MQAADFSQSFNRYSYCWNNPLKFTDPNGQVIFVPILIAVGVGMLVDYGIQVTTNYLQRMPGDNWEDFLFNKIDFADVAISGLASGITVGLGELYKVGKISKTFLNIGTNITKFGLPAVSAGINYTPEDGWEFSTTEDFLVDYTFNTLIKTNIATKYSDDTVDALFGDKTWKFGKYMEVIKQFADVPAAILFNSWGRSYTEEYRENPGFKNDNFPVMPPIVHPITLPKENKNNSGQRIMEALVLYH